MVSEPGAAPLVNLFTQASQDMDVYLSTIFQAISVSCDNYLRIHDDTLVKDLASADLATKKNLENLVKFAKGLLKQPVSLVNLDNGISEPVNRGTNEEALRR
ncbi:hypothetical protein MLD38_022303 [Melastoma candidum]|uniref:Uncharacterized protein n=1 Tax=Melastoma candidum TaxID=119954 RepID=A0ACB9QI02_9MYRT|nr:hypothetical protein MLD38_022303 [Melastoma candidum]